MKRKLGALPLILMCMYAISLAGYSDGYITAGEYEYRVRWFSNNPSLVVEGGGADVIEVRDFGRLEVRSTSLPLELDIGGIFNLDLLGSSHLDYLGGLTDIIDIASNATVDLRGGSINYILSRQNTSTKHINIYCQSGWSWLYEFDSVQQKDVISGITGLWQDGTGFSIDFIDDDNFGYPPVWKNININEVPEPVTLALLGLGGLVVQCRG